VSVRDLFLLDPDVAFLNHGSYGACPRPVFDAYGEWQRELERQPVEFLNRRLDGLIASARAELAAYVGAGVDDLVFVPNATAGLNAVLRSLPLGPEDEVLTTAHEYGALVKTLEFVGARRVVAEPHELADAIGPRTRVVYLSHITSPTAIVLPVEEVCAAAREAGALSVVDGAHVPGHIPLELESLGADVYAGNCHKWLCAPKGSGFLWARPEHHGWIAPLVVSWGWGAETSFAERHGWQGTRDPAAYLAVPEAIRFVREHGREEERRELLRGFVARLPHELVPGEHAPYMAAWELPPCDAAETQRRLYDEHRVEVVVREWRGRPLLRVSIGPYSEASDLGRLEQALPIVLRRCRVAARDLPTYRIEKSSW
jgi:isopenicillin-N epimerase